MIITSKQLFYIGIGLCFALALFFSLYHLTESPKTWLDEGLITQVARNYATFGQYKTQTAPGHFVSAWHISTGCTVVCPIAGSFKLFGYSLLAARLVMVFYILALLLIGYFLLTKITTLPARLLALSLLITFAPLYGHGRNVLGEVPGLLFLFSALFFLNQIEHSKKGSVWHWLWLGLVTGLCITTKPIFILLLPALVVGIICLGYHRGVRISWLPLALGVMVPVIVWISLQFSGESFSRILTFYGNPQDSNIWSSLTLNLKRFFTESQPAYALILLVAWLGSIWYRWKQGKRIGVGELVGITFSSLIMGAYLRTAGFYRYFFPAQFLALFYLVPSWFEVLSHRPGLKRIFTILVLGLVSLQIYQTVFNSWVAESINSTDTADSLKVISQETVGKSVYIYGAPEAVTFLPHNNYWQYINLTKTIVIGGDTLPLIQAGVPDIIIANTSDSVAGPYILKNKVSRFAIWSRM